MQRPVGSGPTTAGRHGRTGISQKRRRPTCHARHFLFLLILDIYLK